jgi:S-formylglutathione hydrolase FrmB
MSAVTTADSYPHHLSLMDGWFPLTVQVLAAIALVLAIGWRTRRWRRVWLPWSLVVGAILALAVYWFVASEGLAGEPAPRSLWVWTALVGTALAVLVAGWRSAAWWRRGVSALAVPLCLMCAALAVNLWTGYFPNVQAAWGQLTAGPLPDQIDTATVTTLQQHHSIPAKGTVVSIDTGDAASGFRHRTEIVYLPPAWYATDPPPRLPTLMMIGGEFNTPADWLRAGDAVKTADDFAAAHAGNAPVLVFVDAGGTFRNDTECVNGVRGNSADHLTRDVVPYLVSHFGVSPARTSWGVVGWSMGGTCAVDLSVMHPDMFSAFEDIAGDVSPNSGDKAQTVSRLFGGSTAAWASFDPSTVMTRHGAYDGVAGWFDVNVPAGEQTRAAATLCKVGAAHGITCAIEAQPGKHDWPFAAQAFAAALPWLAGRVHTPGVASAPLPGAPPASATYIQTAAR